MLQIDVQLPQEQRFELRNFRGFTDWTCNCPPGWFNVIDNIDIQDDGSLCVRNGSVIFCEGTSQSSLFNFRIERLACFKDKIFIFQEKKLFCKDRAGNLLEVEGPKGGDLLDAADENSCSDHDTWNEHMLIVDDACSQPKKLYCNPLGQVVAKSMGLPELFDCPIIQNNPNLTVVNGASYVYAFFWCCEYLTASGTTYQDVGPVKFVEVTNAPTIGTFPENFTEISNIPELACPPGFQFNLANTNMHIYRTTPGGTTFFEVARIPHGQATYQDGLQDNVLQNNQVIYNQGTNTVFTPAPQASFIEVIDDVAWYGGRTCVDGAVFENRLYQSIPGTPWSSPRDWFIEFEGRINGISQYARFPIVSVIDDCGDCKLYRIQGRLDIFSRDALVPYEISSATAAINNNSFVRSETGLYFFGFGGSGIYRTDGYQIQKVTDPKCNFDETYCRMIETEVQRKNVVGEYDKKDNRIYWGVTTEPGLAENNRILVYHEQHNAFTWYTNEGCFNPTALTYDQVNNTLLRGDASGLVFEHTEEALTDAVIIEGIESTKHIPWCLRTVPTDFGDCVSNKQVNRFYLRGKPDTNATIAIKGFDEGCAIPTSLNGIEFKHTDGYCSDDELFCENPAGWCVGTECHMYQNRRFPCTRTMSKDKAIELCPESTILECGQIEDVDFITFNAQTQTFTKPNNMVFTRNDIGQTIEFNGVSTPIIDVMNGKALVNLFESGIPTGQYAWALRGFPKNERICIDCMGYFYCVVGDVGGEFQASQSKALSWDNNG